MSEVNVALIGYQFMGKAHSNAYRQVRRFFPGKLEPRLKVICGRNQQALEAAARQFGWEETETDWRRVVERDDIEIVDIATPGYLHHPMALAAAAAGKHNICENPLANTLAEAQEMLRAVKKAGVAHMVMHNYRKLPAIAYLKALIEEGRLGTVYHYHGAYLQDWIISPQFPLVWRLDKKLTGSGAWGAKGQKGKGKVTVDDEANFLAQFKNASLGVFESSRFCAGRRNYNTFQIYGNKGSAAYNLERLNELEFYDGTEPQAGQGFKTINVTESVHPYVGAWWPPGHIIGYEHTFVHAVHDFLAALEKGRMPSPSFEDAVQDQAVLDAIERSAKSKKWERVRG